MICLELGLHWWSFIGSLCLSVAIVLIFKASLDKGSKKTWRWFWRDKWDDFVGIFFFGQVGTVFMEQGFAFYVNHWGTPDDWDWFIDSQELFAWLLGAVGMSVFFAFYELWKITLKVGLTYIKKRLKKL